MYDGSGSLFAIGTRITKLSESGAPLVGANNAYVTDALVAVGLGLEYEDGEEIIQRNGAGRICLAYRAPDTLTRGLIDSFQVCSPDPNILQFLIGGNIISRAGTAEVQTVTITGTPTGGTFTLTYDGQTTAPIAFDATNTAVDTALEALSNLEPGDVTVTGGPAPGTPFVVTFTVAQGDVPLMTASGAGLTGGTAPAVAVTLTTPGTNLTEIGYRAPEVGGNPVPYGVSLEFWAQAMQDGATAADLPYWHWVVPRAFVRPSENFTLSGEDPMLPTFEGYSQQNTNWGDGPEGDWPYPSDRVWQYVREASADVPDFTRGLIAVA